MRHYTAELTHGARVDDAWTYRGLQAVVIENETLRAVLLADLGANVYSLVHKPSDTEFLWRSPWGARDPRRHVPSTGDPIGVWVDYYHGGWQTVLPNGGTPASYAGADLGQHAEANLLPWDTVVLEEGPQRASVRFTVRLARTPLRIEKTVSLEAGAAALSVREVVTNVGRQAVDISYGQHIALGPPFLSGDCVVDLPGGTVRTHPVAYSPNSRFRPGSTSAWPTGVLRDGTEVSMREVPPEGAGYDDQAYIADMPDGWYAVTNTRLGVGVAVRYPHELYRHLWFWQMFSGGEGYPWWGEAYTLGLEPFTSATNQGLEAALADGSALRLEAGEQIASEVIVSAFRSEVGVRDVGPGGAVVTLDNQEVEGRW